MDKSFPNRKRCNLWKKKFKIKIQIFANFFCCPLSPILSLFGHNFCPWALIEEKLHFHKAYQFFTKIFKK